MGAPVPKGLKPLSLAKFDRHNNPYEHIASINMQVVIIGAPDSLKCKMLSDTFKDAVLRWYMGLSRAYINNSQELVHQFSANRHRNMSTTNIFNIQQGSS